MLIHLVPSFAHISLHQALRLESPLRLSLSSFLQFLILGLYVLVSDRVLRFQQVEIFHHFVLLAFSHF